MYQRRSSAPIPAESGKSNIGTTAFGMHTQVHPLLVEPLARVEARIEVEGFIWSGKWLFFDNIHFEYRPEVLLLAEE